MDKLIDRACQNRDPVRQISLNLDVVEFLQPDLDSCRSVLSTVLKYVNDNSSTVSLAAISLLDACVINLGYPLQLQVSAPEFLDGLVSRFPARAPEMPTASMNAILRLVSKWHSSFVTYYLQDLRNDADSRESFLHFRHYYDDFVNIHRLYRVLASRGYVFPSVSRSAIQMLMPFGSRPLLSRGEYERELGVMQQYRLTGLLKSRNEDDLNRANDIIRDMTGYEDNDYWKYRSYLKRGLNQIQQSLNRLTRIPLDTKQHKDYQDLLIRLQDLVQTNREEDFPAKEADHLLDSLNSKLWMARAQLISLDQ